VKGLVTMLFAALTLGCSTASFNQIARPSGSLGPYYPPSPAGLPFYPAAPWSEVASDDLTRRNGARAAGAALDVRLLVLDARGAPIAGATVELWSVNTHARYVCEPGASDEDPGFVGFGRVVTASDGSASFRTV
jgi:protocatechuate 3,4-dioxygenase beta subunit